AGASASAEPTGPRPRPGPPAPAPPCRAPQHRRRAATPSSTWITCSRPSTAAISTSCEKRETRRTRGERMATLKLNVNATARSVELDDPETPLLYVLRNDLGLTGTHFGCGLSQCGASTVLIAGPPTPPCVTP